MEYQKTIDLLDTAPSTMLRFNIKKWIEIHDQSGGIYNARKQIRFKILFRDQIYANILMPTLLSKELLPLHGQIIEREQIGT